MGGTKLVIMESADNLQNGQKSTTNQKSVEQISLQIMIY